MQWLIELIIEAIGIPPTFVQRPEVFVADFAIGDLTLDGAFHTLDLSAIVPAKASAVQIRIDMRADAVEKFVFFRKHGYTNWITASDKNTQAANIVRDDQVIVGIGPDGLVDYAFSPGTFNLVFLMILGWWL